MIKKVRSFFATLHLNGRSNGKSTQLAAQKRAEIEKINLRLQKLLDSFLDGIIDRDDYTGQKTKLMSQKKSLQEQSTALLAGRADWLEPFQNWILTAKKRRGNRCFGFS